MTQEFKVKENEFITHCIENYPSIKERWEKLSPFGQSMIVAQVENYSSNFQGTSLPMTSSSVEGLIKSLLAEAQKETKVEKTRTTTRTTDEVYEKYGRGFPEKFDEAGNFRGKDKEEWLKNVRDDAWVVNAVESLLRAGPNATVGIGGPQLNKYKLGKNDKIESVPVEVGEMLDFLQPRYDKIMESYAKQSTQKDTELER